MKFRRYAMLSKIGAQFKEVFGGTNGQDVLWEICELGKMFESCSTEEDLGRSNLAKEIFALAMSTEGGTEILRRKIKTFFRKRRRKKRGINRDTIRRSSDMD